MPGRQALVLVFADQQEQRGAGPFGLQLVHRVERVARALALQFAAVEQEARLAGDRRLHHRRAVLGARELVAPLPGLAGRHPAQLVECQVRQRRAGELQVAGVRRVEAAPEQAQALHGRAAQGTAQSRGRRKSLYSRASGVPGSGCQS